MKPFAPSKLPARLFVATGAAALALQGCALDDGPSSGNVDNTPPLSPVDELLEGAPKTDEIDRLYPKADGNQPIAYDIVEYQSPVESQGRRGTCSIFSTVALMENLYILEGTIEEPNFSEQYLQWSAKVEAGGFTNSMGSTASTNIQAIHEYGIPEDHYWPYEANAWTTDDDPACDGSDRMPTRCYTNGDPPEEALEAPKYHLPRSEWMRPADIKAHIHSTDQAVVAGMQVYYQAWNHGASSLPTNDDYWADGIVTTPNQADIQDSEAQGGGHSILLVGWDDELEIQRLDENAEPMVDENGEPVVDRGFYIFKNSWGTDSFGVDNEYGAGYGYIAQDYIHDHARLRISDVPEDISAPGGDVCEPVDGEIDCSDPACADEPICDEDSAELTYEGEGGAIPDNDPVGVSSTIEVAEEGTIAELYVDVEITHTYRGDLTVSLHRGSEAVVLHEREGGSAQDLYETYEVSEWDGQDMAGEWELVVTDTAPQDTGDLERWTLRVVPEEADL